MPLEPGIYTPSATFFKKDLHTIDFETQIAHTKFLQKNGIKGVVLLGSTGENAHLTREERFQLVKTISSNVPNFPILVGIASNSYEDALTEIENAKKAGASYALVLSSSYFGPSITQEGIIDYFTKIADNSVLPVLLYLYPGVTNGLIFKPSTVIKLSKHPNIIGTKLSHADIADYIQIGLSPDINSGKNGFQVFTGLGNLLLPALSVGIVGAVDAISGAFPKVYVELFDAFQSGDLQKAKKLQLIITKAEEVLRYGVIGIKKTIHLQGFGETHLGRMPLNHDIPDGGWESLDDSFADIRSYDTSSK